MDSDFRAPVQYLIQNHLPSHIFLPIITRDTPSLLPKPDPAGILHIAREWGLTNRAENLIMVCLSFYLPFGSYSQLAAYNPTLPYRFQVGDSIDDMTSGHAAGAATVLLVNERNSHLREHAHTDLCIHRLDELIDILEEGFLGREENDVHEN